MERFKNNSVLANLISSYMTYSEEGLFTTRTVGELLWGYEDSLLKALKTVEPELDDVFGLFYKVSLKPMNMIFLHRLDCGDEKAQQMSENGEETPEV